MTTPEEYLIQAHNALHQDDPDRCHSIMHAAMGIDPDGELLSREMAPMSEFDRRFRELCIDTGYRAMYLLDDRGRTIAGGSAELCAHLETYLDKATGRKPVKATRRTNA